MADMQGTLEAEEILEHSQGGEEELGGWEDPSLDLVCSISEQF